LTARRLCIQLAERAGVPLREEMKSREHVSRNAAAVSAITAILRLRHIPAEPDQVAHTLGDGVVSGEDIVRYLRRSGLRSRIVNVGMKRLTTVPLPAIAAYDDGTFVLVAKATEDRLLVFDPATQRPSILPAATFAAHWTGELILASRRAGLADLTRRFDIGWFLGAIHKYRWILGEVFAASLFLQIFALLSPLFFQVVIDKVLVHRPHRKRQGQDADHQSGEAYAISVEHRFSSSRKYHSSPVLS
jgi:subfamily B ATP-binding cassette protein HlyB/CyaB